MPAVPKRKAATRARETISNQYTAPFGPRPGQKRKLVNTATRYEKEDEAFKPEGYLHRTLGEQFPKAFDARSSRSRETSKARRASAGSSKGGARKGKGRELSTSSDVPLDQFLVDSGDTEVGPGRSAIGVGAGGLKGVKRERSMFRKINDGASTASPAGSHRRKLSPAAPAAISIIPTTLPVDFSDMPTPERDQKPRFWQFGEASSPLTPRSSDQSDADAEGELDEALLSAPASPVLSPIPVMPSLTAIDPALSLRSTAPQEQAPVQSTERWWADVSPQPPSSSLSEPESHSAANSTQAIRDRLTVPPVPPGGRAMRESSDSLSSIRWSPRSGVSPDGDGDQTPGAGPSRIESIFAQQDIDAQVGTTGASPSASLAPITSSFRPRSQAFQCYTPIPEQPLHAAQPKEENEEPDRELELKAAWALLRVAHRRMELAMAAYAGLTPE